MSAEVARDAARFRAVVKGTYGAPLTHWMRLQAEYLEGKGYSREAAQAFIWRCVKDVADAMPDD